MKKFNLLFLGLLAASLTFYGCKKDEDDDPVDNSTTVSQDKSNITSSLDQIVSCVSSMRHGDLITTIEELTGIVEGEIPENGWFINSIEDLEGVFDFEHIDNNATFDISHHAGTYTFDNNTKSWSKSDSPTDAVVVTFPSDSTSNTNNVEIKINAYTTQSYVVDGNSEELPTNINYSISKDGNVLHSFAINNIQYRQLADIAIPIDANITVVLAPYTLDIDASEISGGGFEGSISLSTDGGCSFNVVGSLNLATTDYENITDDDFRDASLTVTSNSLKLQASADLETLMAIDDPTSNQVNNNIDVDVLYNNQTIGNLEIKNLSESDDDPEVWMVYKDGTSEEVGAAYLEDFVDDLEAAIDDLVGSAQ